MVNFGFEEISGNMVSVKITNRRGINFLGRLAIPTLRNTIVARMNHYGRLAAKRAKKLAPVDIGDLRDSIVWEHARRNSFTRVTTGRVSVGVVYGRRQHFEHKTKKHYIWKALKPMAKNLAKDLAKRKVQFGEILVGGSAIARGGDAGGDFANLGEF